MPSPGEPQAEPTIAKAINCGYDLLEAKCNRCDRVSLVPLRSLQHPPETPGLEAGGGALLRAVQQGAALQPSPAGAHPRADLCAAGAGAWTFDCNQASAMKRTQKIRFGEMREMGVRGVLIWCADYKCSHSTAISADQWPDHVRLSKLRQVDVVRKLANPFPVP
jgi:hypothetical protein